MQDPQRRAYLKEYRAEHGHHPEDIKARIDCTVCQVKSLVEHAIISVQASGDPQKYVSFIDSTTYSDSVKSLAKLRMEAL